MPPSVNIDANMQQKTDVSSLPAGNGDDKTSVDIKHNTINNGPDGVSSANKTGCPSSTTIDEDPKDDTVEVNASVDEDVGR
ncbi:katanin p60 ATPase-containing subunit [Trifolium pratense]|uniref:Katanin p60 ATPase-containing subunit n=1 Tax=Trifolium pratense TaxID=57577 RepID=A0A2K3LW57_TRIPR|nr:katanin p60 ATPase-containing subunit [Trifolium pratense]